jgi:hypothetical protein
VLQLSFIAVPKAVTTIMPQSFHQEGVGKIVILNLFWLCQPVAPG